MLSSGGRSSPLFNCTESQRARQKLDALAASDSRFQNIWNGVVWLVLRNPYIGSLIPGKTATFVIITDDFLAIEMPVMEVYYTIQSASVVEFR